MDEINLQELLQLVIQDKGGKPQDYYNLMDYIAFHETGAEQRMDPKAVQITKSGKKDGVGRGLFMFEVGHKEGANSAINRTVQYLKKKNIPLPQWLRQASLDSKETKSYDVTKLNADQQKMLFLGNHRMHPTSNFSKVWSGEQSVQDFWLKNHWSGKDNPQEKLNSFIESMAAKDSLAVLESRKEDAKIKQTKMPFLATDSTEKSFQNSINIFNNLFRGSSILQKIINERD